MKVRKAGALGLAVMVGCAHAPRNERGPEYTARTRWYEVDLVEPGAVGAWPVDVIDPATGCRYEILSGTKSNLERHGRRMAGEFFRMLTF